jgi:hypothetical protein
MFKLDFSIFGFTFKLEFNKKKKPKNPTISGGMTMSNTNTAEAKIPVRPSSDKSRSILSRLFTSTKSASPWSELYSAAKAAKAPTGPFDLTNLVFEDGKLVAYHRGEKKACVPLKQVDGVFFSPVEGKTLDAFVFVSEAPGIRRYIAEYMGTVQRDSNELKSARNTLNALNIKYALPTP